MNKSLKQLRLRSPFVKATESECVIVVESAIFDAIFNLVKRVGLPYFFGTPKNSSLKINSLQSNNFFSHRNVL